MTTSNNAATGNFSEWTYDDGGVNSSPQSLIEDTSRASEGDQFVHIPLPANTSTFNYCIANGLAYSGSVTQCEDDKWFNNMRYVFTMDYVPFNQDYPEGGVGQAYPACEHNVGGFKELDMYDKYGNHISGEPAVAWNDVGNSWRTAYAVTDELSGFQNMTMWISLNKNSTTGILIDNTYLSPLRISDAGLVETNCGGTNAEIDFALSPISNVGNVPNVNYIVCPPSGYSITPETGVYGEITDFTLTADSGDFSSGSPSSITITVTDEINKDCVVTTEVENPYPNCRELEGAIGNKIWVDEDSDGIFSEGERGLPNVKIYLHTPQEHGNCS